MQMNHQLEDDSERIPSSVLIIQVGCLTGKRGTDPSVHSVARALARRIGRSLQALIPANKMFPSTHCSIYKNFRLLLKRYIIL